MSLRRFVLTGAPGSGKTLLLQALAEQGWSVVPHAATDVIAAEQARGVDEPWERNDLVDSVVSLQRQREVTPPAAGADVQVFDRSPLCTLALTRYLRRPVSPLLAAEVDRVLHEHVYEPQVLLVRPLGFVQATAARRVRYEDSLVFERVHVAVYREHGFTLVDVPPAELSNRVAVVKQVISKA
ncbi:MAG: hypothetical protein AVDCRST_MAG93-1295 [uncultured Chloroflexia bacterium]|uniref:NadR/Ttd14 AAA domain-containing protein n=1 Tax=uncultured Chloroflexia bacterium TaxID=1672391 RepID=A0A6J4I1T9_9CHLR|nr:MAG: hypothetical protein AVDCRST_MAG93-1295 [uncultured Chloroflexia bacterium]